MANSIKQIVSAKSSITVTLNSLATATYVASSTIDFTSGGGVGAAIPLDGIIEVEITPGTVAGNKQCVVFLQESLDNTNFSTGPTSGTTTTDQPDLYQIGVLPLNTNATLQRKAFSIVTSLGWLPPFVKIVYLNDSGAAFAAAGCASNVSTVIGTFI